VVSTKLFALLLSCNLLVTSSLIVQAKELKVGIGNIYYPPYYFEQDGVMHGAVIEMAQHIATNFGHTLVFEQYPWSRIQLYLRQGTIDMVILYFKTPARQADVIYTDIPHIYDSSYLVSKRGAAIDFDGDLSKLKHYKFGNVRASSHGATYDNAKGLNKQLAVDEAQLLRMLLRARIDLAVANKAVISMHAQHSGTFDKIGFINPPIDVAPAFFAFSKAQPSAKQLANQFSIEIKKLLTTKKYQRILDKYQLGSIDTNSDN